MGTLRSPMISHLLAGPHGKAQAINGGIQPFTALPVKAGDKGRLDYREFFVHDVDIN
jgi:hypothetical protein